MRRTVLAQRDAVMGEHVDHVQPHQRRKPDGRPHVIGKDQKGRAERYGSAVRRNAVQNCAHRMFAHAEMQIAAGRTPATFRALSIACARSSRFEVSQSFERGVSRWIQIGGAADQCGHARRDRVHHLAGGNPRCHAFGVGREVGNVGIPIQRCCAETKLLELLRKIGERVRVG